MDHGTYRELAAGAVLDDLDRAEMAALEAHRATCRDCRDLLEDLGGVAFDLALAAPPRRPPPALLDSVLTGLRVPTTAIRPALPTVASSPSIPPAGPGTPGSIAGSSDVATLRREARRLRAFAMAGLAAAAALAVVAVGLGVRSVQLSDEVATARADALVAEAALATQNADMSGAMTVALDPSHLTASLHAEPIAPNASAVIVYRPGTDDAYLIATNLPATQADSVYQLWFADASGVHGLGTFRFDGRGSFVAPFRHDLADASAAMVTLEHVGGALDEPGPQVVFGEL